MTAEQIAPTTPSSDTAIPTRARLNWLTAIWNSLVERDVSFYPRIVDNGKIISLSTDVVLTELTASASAWNSLDAMKLSDALSLARQSLDEVKEQTEYQDAKATRLLTVATILSALSGVLFSRFIDAYPLKELHHYDSISTSVILAVYGLFAASVLSALAGAIVIFHATRTRFKYPDLESASKQDKDPKSLLFFSPIIRSRPRAWMRAWAGSNAPELQAELRTDLASRYLHNLISETYLIAAKTADKLRYLEPAQGLLALSLKLVFVWLILLLSASTCISTIKPVQEPTNVRLVSGNGAVPIEVRAGATVAVRSSQNAPLQIQVLQPKAIVPRTINNSDSAINPTSAPVIGRGNGTRKP